MDLERSILNEMSLRNTDTLVSLMWNLRNELVNITKTGNRCTGDQWSPVEGTAGGDAAQELGVNRASPAAQW